jgi:hypothetical protein
LVAFTESRKFSLMALDGKTICFTKTATVRKLSEVIIIWTPARMIILLFCAKRMRGRAKEIEVRKE